MLDRKIQQWRQLLPWERRVLMSLLWRLSVAGLLLRLVNIGKVLALANSSQRQSLPAGFDAQAFARRCEQLVCIAARNGLHQATCLPRALALQHVLGSFGVTTELRIGVVPGSQPLQAHAWVVFEQQALGGEVAQYQPIAMNKGSGSMPSPLMFDAPSPRK